MSPDSIVLPEHPSLLDPTKFNILIPTPELADNLPLGIQFRMVAVSVDGRPPDEGGQDVWKSGDGKRREGDTTRWVKLYELSDRALNRIRIASRMDTWADLVLVQGNTRIYKGHAKKRMADGRWLHKADDYEMNVDARIEEFRAKMEDTLADRGHLVVKRWQESDSKSPGDKGRYAEVKLNHDAARAHIERQVRDQSIHLRKFATSIASTRCQMKVVRSFLAIRGHYDPAELLRPFVTYYYQFPASMPDTGEEVLLPGETPLPIPQGEGRTQSMVDPAPPVATPPDVDLFNRKLADGKPTIAERIKIIKDLGFDELRELGAEVVAVGKPMPGFETILKHSPRPDLESFILNIYDLLPKAAR